MKKIYLLFLSIIAAFVISNEAKAQLNVNVQFRGACDSAEIYISGTGPNSDLSAYTSTIAWGDGTINQFPNAHAIFAAHDYDYPGIYTVLVNLYDNMGNIVYTGTETAEVACYAIRGYLYQPNDNDCIRNPTELLLGQYVQIEVKKDGIPIDTVRSYGTGSVQYSYSYEYFLTDIDYNATYTMEIMNNNTGYNVLCPANNQHSFTISSLSPNTEFDFGLECNSAFTGYDLYAHLRGWYRSIGASHLYISGGNATCLPEDAKIVIELDPLYKYDASGSMPPHYTVSGNLKTITINETALNGGFTYYIPIVPDGTVPLGYVACSDVVISKPDGSMTGDINQHNNFFEFCDTARSSYDPNNKHASPGFYINTGGVITYTINFENLGNDTAFNIHILDTIATELDIRTFKIITSSHNVNAAIYGNQVVKFNFSDIRLPDASSLDYNKGYVVYQIKTKPGLPNGTDVYNTAHIYFDSNPAIVTNTTHNKTPIPTAVRDVHENANINCYPNPVQTHINFNLKSNSNVRMARIVDISGREVLLKDVTSGTNSLDIARLDNAVYVIQFIDINNKIVQSSKFTKK